VTELALVYELVSEPGYMGEKSEKLCISQFYTFGDLGYWSGTFPTSKEMGFGGPTPKIQDHLWKHWVRIVTVYVCMYARGTRKCGFLHFGECTCLNKQATVTPPR
jgi:hypothetical protein